MGRPSLDVGVSQAPGLGLTRANGGDWQVLPVHALGRGVRAGQREPAHAPKPLQTGEWEEMGSLRGRCSLTRLRVAWMRQPQAKVRARERPARAVGHRTGSSSIS